MNTRDNLWGIAEGKRAATIEEEKRKTAQLESDLRLRELKAGIPSVNQLQALSLSSEGKLYIILGLAVIGVIIAIVIIKRKKKTS